MATAKSKAPARERIRKMKEFNAQPTEKAGARAVIRQKAKAKVKRWIKNKSK